MADSSTLFRAALRENRGDVDGDAESGLPSQAEGQYRPFANPANKPLYAIHFVMSKGGVTSFQYMHLDSNSEYHPDCITLRFIGFAPVIVRIEGRNLWRLYDYIHQHRMPWVAEASRDFAGDGQPIVVKFVFEVIGSEEL